MHRRQQQQFYLMTMLKENIKIRPIQKEDNAQVAQMIRSVLLEVGAPKTGTAYADRETARMYPTYDRDYADYFLIESGGEILGGCGIAPLAGGPKNICELQKMYFRSTLRGKGFGKKMMDHCLDFAHKENYEAVYIETLPSMKAAQKLYKRSGFHEIDERLGKTGHHSCTVWMLRELVI